MSTVADDEIKHTEADGDSGDGGGGNGIPRRSRSERAEFADVVLAWAAAVESHRATLVAWELVIENLRASDRALNGHERDSTTLELLRTIEQMRVAEELSADTRGYLDAIANQLK